MKKPVHASPVTVLVSEEPLLMNSAISIIGGKGNFDMFAVVMFM